MSIDRDQHAPGDLFRVKEGTPLRWIGMGDPNEKHWAAGKVGTYIRPSLRDPHLRIKFDRTEVEAEEGYTSDWFHPDELEVLK